jgi:hypothetical protein
MAARKFLSITVRCEWQKTPAFGRTGIAAPTLSNPLPWGTNHANQSEFANQIARLDSQRLGDSQQCVQTDPLLAAFDFSHINRVQISLFRKFFLGHTNPFAAIPYDVAQNFQLSRTRHGLSAKQDQRNERTPNMGLFYLANFRDMA